MRRVAYAIVLPLFLGGCETDADRAARQAVLDRAREAEEAALRGEAPISPQLETQIRPSISGPSLFGVSLAFSGDGRTLVIGDSWASTEEGLRADEVNGDQNGAVYVYGCEDGGCRQLALLRPPRSGRRLFFGHTVAISGDGNTLAATLLGESNAASAPSAGPSGVYVYERGDDEWRPAANLHPETRRPGDEFGSALALDADGTTLAISGTGGILVFEKTEEWSRSAVIPGSAAHLWLDDGGARLISVPPNSPTADLYQGGDEWTKVSTASFEGRPWSFAVNGARSEIAACCDDGLRTMRRRIGRRAFEVQVALDADGPHPGGATGDNYGAALALTERELWIGMSGTMYSMARDRTTGIGCYGLDAASPTLEWVTGQEATRRAGEEMAASGDGRMLAFTSRDPQGQGAVTVRFLRP